MTKKLTAELEFKVTDILEEHLNFHVEQFEIILEQATEFQKKIDDIKHQPLENKLNYIKELIEVIRNLYPGYDNCGDESFICTPPLMDYPEIRNILKLFKK